MIRPKTLWPFPVKAFDKVNDRIKKYMDVEMSMGQMVPDVAVACNDKHKVEFYGRTGGMVPTVDEIVGFGKKVMEANKDGNVFETKALTDEKLHYCPGCAHCIVHRLLAECLEESGEDKNAICAVPVGCAVFANTLILMQFSVHMVVHLQQQQVSKEYTLIKWLLHIKVMVTWLPLVLVKS